MKKRYLALLLVMPLLLLCASVFLFWAEDQLLVAPQVKIRESVQILKERALHADKEANPQARIEVLSKALIGAEAATDSMVGNYAQLFQNLAQFLASLAMLQILISVCVFLQMRWPDKFG